MKRFNFFIFIFSFFYLCSFSQSGGNVYKVLDLPASSYISSLGGMNISSQANEISMATQNPSLLTGEQHQKIGVNFSNYLSKSNFFSAMYGHQLSENDVIAGFIQYVSFGKFAHTTEENVYLGMLPVKDDVVMSVIYSRRLAEKFHAGVSMKPVMSFLADYQSFGVAVDVGANFYDRNIGFSGGVAFKNIGVQFKNYTSSRSAPLPFSIQLGMSQKLKHAPFCFSLTIHDLQRWNLNPNPAVKVNFADMLFRHTTWGIEFTPKGFYVALGYNRQRGAELSVKDIRSLAGFSAGLGFRVYKFNIGASISQYQKGIWAFQVSASTAVSSFLR